MEKIIEKKQTNKKTFRTAWSGNVAAIVLNPRHLE